MCKLAIKKCRIICLPLIVFLRKGLASKRRNRNVNIHIILPLQVKGSKGVYQFLFKPYEVRKDHQSVCKEDIAESLQDSLSNISEMISDFSEKERSHPKETGNNLQNDKDEPSTSFRNIILNNREFRVNNSEEKVENVGESSGNSSRTESLSRSSISTDRSCGVSLEDLDLHANLINADLTCDEVDCFFDDTHGSDIFPQWNID